MWRWAAAVVLGLALTSPAVEASTLGAVVTLEPSDPGAKQVMAHTSILVPEPCPSLTDVACEGTGCITHVTSAPIRGQHPSPGWCLRQWQSIVPFIHTSHQLLGVSVNCFQKFYLNVTDLDGDRVRCRYGNPERGECQRCSRHEFLQLDERSCVLTYTGRGETGHYKVELMVEDFLSNDINGDSKALSSTPLQLFLTVAGASSDCKALPTFTEKTPAEGAVFTVLPYEEVNITIEAHSSPEMITEIATVGPPGLSMSALKREQPRSLASINISWLRNRKQLPQLLPVCFTANTQSFQSETRCVWIKQKPVDSLPPGTVLRCGDTEMTFSFPISSVPDLLLSDLQLNDPFCAVSHNDTHVMASIPLDGCSTKTAHSGPELVFSNTLRTSRDDSPIRRRPTLLLRLSCRYPPGRVSGPRYKAAPVDEEETFGEPKFWLAFYPPGSEEGQDPTVHANMLDLHVISNGSVDRAELMVMSCEQSPTPGFEETTPLVQNGCTTGSVELRAVIQNNKVKVYRIDLASIVTPTNTMYVQCMVRLCIPMVPSQQCPDECKSSRAEMLEEAVFTKNYIVRSGPVFTGNSVTPSTPTPTPNPTTTAPTTTLPSCAPEDSFLAVGVALGVLRMFLGTLFL